MSQKRKYDPLFGGFSKKDEEGVFVFGPRMARAVIIHALVVGDQFVGDGLHFSYRELKTLWYEAVVDALTGTPERCGLLHLLGLIKVQLDRRGSSRIEDKEQECYEVTRLCRNLNHQVYRDVCILVGICFPGKSKSVGHEYTFKVPLSV